MAHPPLARVGREPPDLVRHAPARIPRPELLSAEQVQLLRSAVVAVEPVDRRHAQAVGPRLGERDRACERGAVAHAHAVAVVVVDVAPGAGDPILPLALHQAGAVVDFARLADARPVRQRALPRKRLVQHRSRVQRLQPHVVKRDERTAARERQLHGRVVRRDLYREGIPPRPIRRPHRAAGGPVPEDPDLRPGVRRTGIRRRRGRREGEPVRARACHPDRLGDPRRAVQDQMAATLRRAQRRLPSVSDPLHHHGVRRARRLARPAAERRRVLKVRPPKGKRRRLEARVRERHVRRPGLQPVHAEVVHQRDRVAGDHRAVAAGRVTVGLAGRCAIQKERR